VKSLFSATAPTRCIVSWCILQKIPKFKILEINHSLFQSRTLGPSLDAPTPAERQDYRSLDHSSIENFSCSNDRTNRRSPVCVRPRNL
jgi:hypothetical protein